MCLPAMLSSRNAFLRSMEEGTSSRRRINNRYFKREASSYNHIGIQKIAELEPEPDANWRHEEYVIRHSEQDNIELGSIIATNTTNRPLPPPLTFAEAVMPPRRRASRRQQTLDDESPKINKPVTLESIATVKFTAIKRKTTKKYAPRPKLEAFDHISAAISAVDSDVGSVSSGPSSWFSRPGSPLKTPQLDSFNLHTQPSSPTSATAEQALLASSPVFFGPDDFPSMNTTSDTSYFTRKGISSSRSNFPSFSINTGRTHTHASTPSKSTDGGVGLEDHNSNTLDVEPTPTQASFNFHPNHTHVDSVVSDSEFPPLSDQNSEARFIKDGISMADLVGAFHTRQDMFDTNSSLVKVSEDAFDSLDWDPDLANAFVIDGTESPEPVPVAPKPVTYTTVGSLVDPNAVTQIAAPNRIQREGVNRRPFMSAPQGRHHDSYYQNRGLMPPLSMSNSMQYAQQFSQSPHRFSYNQTPPPNSGRSSRSALSSQMQPSFENENSIMSRLQNVAQQAASMPSTTQSYEQDKHSRGRDILSGMHEQPLGLENIRPRAGSQAIDGAGTMQNAGAQFPFQLTEHELDALEGAHGQAPHMYSGHVMDLPHAASSYNPKPFLGTADQDNRVFSMRELLEESALGRPNSVQGPVQGLEKMQTLQRLAKFDNPMQGLARSRLEEFSVNKRGGISSPNNPTSALEQLLKNREKGKDSTTTSGQDGGDGIEVAGRDDTQVPGILNRGYQFPPGLPGPLTARNPLNRDLQQPPARGPQPLTAGPPGQRQAALSFMPARPGPSIFQNSWDVTPSVSFNSGHSSYNSTGYVNPNSLPDSPWYDQYIQSSSPEGSRGPRPTPMVAHDPETHKTQDTLLFPGIQHFYPYGMPANLNPKLKPLLGPLLTIEEKEVIKRKKAEDAHYSGQRLWGMSMDDHVAALKVKKARLAHQWGPIAPRSPPESIKKLKTITPEEMNNMSVAEAAAPLLDMMFNTLLEYSQDDTPNSRYNLSNWGPSPPEMIDNDPGGNKTFFGEDWGVPQAKATTSAYRTRT